MKKKLFAALAFVAIASVAFAQYGPPPPYEQAPPPPRYNNSRYSATYSSINFTVPLQWERMEYADESARTLSLGFGVDLTVFLTKYAGLHLSVDVYFPQTRTSPFGGEPVSLKDRGDWGVSFFVGPSFSLVRTQRVLLALSPGIHVAADFVDQGTWGPSSQVLFGAGASAELALNITRVFFIRAAVDVTWDFLELAPFEPGAGNDSIPLNVVPAIGVGFKL